MLKWGTYRLRPLQEKDLRQVLVWRNSERIRRWMLTDHPIAWKEHRIWFDKIHRADPATHLIFECQERLLGLVYFSSLDPENLQGFWGYYLGEEDLPAGTGTLMGFLALDYGFDFLNKAQINSEVLQLNLKSIHYLFKLGFREIEKYRRKVYKNGKEEDLLYFSLNLADWKDKRRALIPKLSEKFGALGDKSF